MQRLMAAKFAPKKKPAVLTSAPSNAAFEAKREQWRQEAIARASQPRPEPRAGRDDLDAAVIEQMLAPPPPAPPAKPVNLSAPLVSRGSCKAINPVTGRQCALLSGHTKPHRHGSTEFHLAAVPGQRIARREELELAASATHSSPFGG